MSADDDQWLWRPELTPEAGARPSLAPVLAKLRRARVHEAEIGRLWNEWLASDAVSVVQQPRDSEGVVWLRWVIPAGVPTELALAFGDMVVNARSALDYLVWQLALLGEGGPTKDHAFPIVRRPEHWADAQRRRLRGIAPAWVEVIRRSQPCFAPEGERGLHPLAILDQLANVNKHRVLQRSEVSIRHLEPQVTFSKPTPPGLTVQLEIPVPPVLADGAPAIGVVFSAPVDVTIEPGPNSIFALRFVDDIPHAGDFPDLLTAVDDLIVVFEPAFKG